MKSILLASAMLASMSVANAANFTRGHDSNGIQVIKVQGEIEEEDFSGFLDAIKTTPTFDSGKRTFVYLTSSGGLEAPGLEIGEMIRVLRFETVVQDYCLSVCGLMWLAGTTRWMFADAIIGFHAAYLGKQWEAEVSSEGNAVAAAYLSRLGLSDKAIGYLTSAPPQSMVTIDKKVADELGIVVKTAGAR